MAESFPALGRDDCDCERCGEPLEVRWERGPGSSAALGTLACPACGWQEGRPGLPPPGTLAGLTGASGALRGPALLARAGPESFGRVALGDCRSLEELAGWVGQVDCVVTRCPLPAAWLGRVTARPPGREVPVSASATAGTLAKLDEGLVRAWLEAWGQQAGPDGGSDSAGGANPQGPQMYLVRFVSTTS